MKFAETKIILLFLSLSGCFGGPMYQSGMASNELELGAPLEPPEQKHDSSFWQVEPDIRLYHFAKGEGRNILFVHGGPGIPPGETHPGLDLLGDAFRVHYYHQRGAGKSTRPFDRFESGSYYKNMKELVRRLGIRAQLADMERIRRILGEKRWILVGHSFGGFFATLYAAEFPDRVEKLILVSPADVLRMPPPSGGLYEIVANRLDEKNRVAFKKYLERLFDFGTIFSKSEKELAKTQNEFHPYYRKAYGLYGTPPGTTKTDPEWTGGWSVNAAYFDLGRKSDFRPILKKIRAKTLLLYGDMDLLPDSSFRDYDGIRDIRYKKIEGAGHFPFQETPERFSRIVRNFIKEDL